MAEAQPLIRVIAFWTEYSKMAKRDEYGNKILDEKGHHILEDAEEDWVTYAPAHNPQNSQTNERVRHMRPDPHAKEGTKARFMAARWSTIGPAYEAWKQGQEIPINGTPLAAWGGVNAAQIEVFRQNAIRTVEELAALTDVQATKVNLPKVREIVAMAQKFLENKPSAESDRRMQDLEDKLAAAMELIEERSAQPVDDVEELKAKCDELGIEYHHKAGAKKLRELLDAHELKAA